MIKRSAVIIGLLFIILGVVSIVNSGADGVTYSTTSSSGYDEPVDFHGNTNDHQSSSTFADHTDYYEIGVPAHANDGIRDHVDYDVDNDLLPDTTDNDNW